MLRGMVETISRDRPPFLIEVLPSVFLLNGSFDRGYFGKLPDAEAKLRRPGEWQAGLADQRHGEPYQGTQGEAPPSRLSDGVVAAPTSGAGR